MSNAQKKDVSIVESKTDKKEEEQKDTRPVCGLIMPIADTEGYPPGHWKEVRKLLISVAEEANFRARVVSESDDVRVIQAAIVQNVYEDDIIICDVSSKNPNVMFELGLRLAFDKAAVIVKDYATGYSFDTSPVEHINYPKDLRYYDIEKFKIELKAKLIATYKESKKPDHSMYLQSFGKFVVKGIKTKEISNEEYILESLREIKSDLSNLQSTKANDYIKPFRQSAPKAIQTHNNTLNEMLNAYMHNKKEGDIVNPRNFYKFISEYQDFLGNDMPSEELAYDFFRSKMK